MLSCMCSDLNNFKSKYNKYSLNTIYDIKNDGFL